MELSSEAKAKLEEIKTKYKEFGIGDEKWPKLVSQIFLSISDKQIETFAKENSDQKCVIMMKLNDKEFLEKCYKIATKNSRNKKSKNPNHLV